MGLNFVLLGPPGAGKGTQAEILARKYRIAHISTGDMLREAVKRGTGEGKAAKAFMDRGELVPDDLVIAMVRNRLLETDAREGFLLDGFPRTREQARNLDLTLEKIGKGIDLAIYLNCSAEVILRRLTGRFVCRNCGKIYNVPNSMPKKEGVCDHCNGSLYQRDDDKKETVLRRLEVYKKQTAELVEYYRQSDVLKEVCGDAELDYLTKDIEAVISEVS